MSTTHPPLSLCVDRKARIVKIPNRYVDKLYKKNYRLPENNDFGEIWYSNTARHRYQYEIFT